MATLWDYQRQLRRVAASRNRSAVQELRQVYADVLQQLQGILGKYYTAYGSGTESTLSQADLRLAGQYQSFLYDVQKQLDGLSAPVQSRIRQTITDTYTLCYDGMAAAVRQAAQGNRTLQEALRGLSDTTPETVRHLVEHPMQELTLSDVFQRQRSRVIREIKKTLTTGLAVGDSYTRMSQAIADVLGGDLAKAQRIVRTEAHRAISRGFQDVSDQTAYLLRESPYMEVKEWCSAEDGDVRSAHRKLDGVVLPVGEEFEVDGKRAACPCGFGVAELDINCRCFLKYSLVLRSKFEDRRRKAKQEQPAAKNTPQVQAGQMTLSTASGQQTPAHAVAVQPTAPPEDGGMGTVYLPEKIEQEEDFKISKKNTSNGFSVNRGFVNSKKYHDQFDGLTEHKPANESVYQQAKRILEDRDGKDTERMAIIDARTGELLTDNLSIGEDSHFKTGLSFEEYQKIKDSEKRFLILHNHPSSTRPSITDILTFWKEEKADASIVVGHDGTVYVIANANRKIPLDKLYEKYYNDYIAEGYGTDLSRLKATDTVYSLGAFTYKIKGGKGD